jgi:SAM-dependent MidA family methyltransferase
MGAGASRHDLMERLDRFMARANAAYYAGRDPFADFTTAPEISQVFGEVLGLWAAVTWRALGAPSPLRLVEAGPGRGTLMRDALRAARVHFIETSARLRERQRAEVPEAAWHDDLSGVPAGPLILLANEFLDALPIRQFVWTGAGWGERYVTDGAFAVVPCAAPPPDACPGAPPAGASEVHERNEPATAFVTALARRIAGGGGAALLIDYGPEHSGPGDSLQAIRDGRPADPLRDPGTADLTAHVDFAALAGAARRAGAAVHGPLPQGVFLARLGLFQRTDRLARGQPPARAAALLDAARRLAEPAAMGRLFKAMALTHPDLPPPDGFAA